MTFRYLGSKSRLADPLSEIIASPARGDGRFIDAFAGTGTVAEIAATNGWPVHVNDALPSAIAMSTARLLSIGEVAFKYLGGYAAVVGKLNAAVATPGYFYRTYSPASFAFDADGIKRMYLTEENAARLDAMRSQIAKWKDDALISDDEECLLLADLISAVNRVANIAGTYGCYLSKWQANSQRLLELTVRSLRVAPIDRTSRIGNAEELRVEKNDLVYLDPPYTKRQYASYYHILDSIVLNDQPFVEGVSGLRPWQSKASTFCYKRRALDALIDLMANIGSSRILLSYSSEGHIQLHDLMEALDKMGDYQITEIDGVGRYRPNVVASARGNAVTEYIVDFRHRFGPPKSGNAMAGVEIQYA